MKPARFRFHSLLEERAREKDFAAREVARADRRLAAVLHALAQVDARSARARAAIVAESTAGPTHGLREAYALLEGLAALRRQLVEQTREAAADRDTHVTQHLRRARAWNAVDMLRMQAEAAQLAYAQRTEEMEYEDSNLMQQTANVKAHDFPVSELLQDRRDS